MNREILFRGFRPDENGKVTITLNGEKIKGEWVEGSLLSQSNKKSRTYIVTHDDLFIAMTGCGECDVAYSSRYQIEIIPETVGQYTGLKDKNGNKIFEGDIGCWRSNPHGHQVSFKDCRFKIEDCYGNGVKPTQGAINHLEFKVIGNIYER